MISRPNITRCFISVFYLFFFGISRLNFQVSLKANTNPFLSFQSQTIQLMFHVNPRHR